MSPVPSLPRGVRLHWDAVRQTNVLLGPERALMLDDVAFQILSRIDGTLSAGQISADLARKFDAPPADVERDVISFFDGLAAKRLLDLNDG